MDRIKRKDKLTPDSVTDEGRANSLSTNAQGAIPTPMSSGDSLRPPEPIDPVEPTGEKVKSRKKRKDNPVPDWAADEGWADSFFTNAQSSNPTPLSGGDSVHPPEPIELAEPTWETVKSEEQIADESSFAAFTAYDPDLDFATIYHAGAGQPDLVVNSVRGLSLKDLDGTSPNPDSDKSDGMPATNAESPILRLLRASGDAAFTLNKPVMRIGRSDPDTDNNPDIPISDDDSVSRRHAELVITGRTVSICDTGSTNGTKLNGKLIPCDVLTTLTPGDKIRVGEFSEFVIE